MFLLSKYLMLKIIHGPTYRYQGEKLDKDCLLYIRDHHYDEKDHCFHIEKLIANSTVGLTVIFDHVVQHDEFLKDPVYFPALLAREAKEFLEQQIQPNWSNKTHAFNFMINKPRMHRNLLLQMIDDLKLVDYRHSLCWQDSPVKSIPVTDFRIGDESIMPQGFKNGHYKNSLTYQKLLKDRIFEPTMISLITEPAYFERETIITEKTIMAIYGGTVPIWVGGWRIPDYMSNVGFDIFDDLVDHSYQSLDDPADRCRRAVENNIDLLKSTQKIDIKRLQHNLNIIQNNPWSSKVEELLDIYPDLRGLWKDSLNLK